MRNRKYLQRLKTDGRYFVQVYPPNGSPSKRVYLGTKDRDRANEIGRMISIPYAQGDVAEVERRVQSAKRRRADYKPAQFTAHLATDAQVADFAQGLSDDEFRKFDRQTQKRLADTKALIDEYWRENDEDRDHVHNAEKELATLDDRPDLQAEFVTAYIDRCDGDVLRSIADALARRTGSNGNQPLTPAALHKVSECVTVWSKRAEARNLTAKHIKGFSGTFQEWADFIGDPFVGHLEKRHLTDWQNHIDQTREERGEQWRTKQLQPIGAVLKEAQRQTDWTFPAELRTWLEVFDYGKPQPKPVNRKALPVETFHALVSKAEELAAMDVHVYAKRHPVSRPNAPLAEANTLKQAYRQKRLGVQWSAILRLAVNVGADNEDISRLTWSDLDLDSDLPLFKLARHKAGEVERFTPLLPTTVKAIQRWAEYEPKRTHVFTNDAKRPYQSDKVSKNFARLCEQAGVDAWFKHCRNVGATVGRDNHRKRNEWEAFLGHKVEGQCVFYLDDAPSDYLLPLVKLIEAKYFGAASK